MLIINVVQFSSTILVFSKPLMIRVIKTRNYVGVDNEITLFQFVKTITPIRGILRGILGAIFNVFIEFESI